MKSQLFKNQIPREFLFDLLKIICENNNKYYVLNKISYKKAEYENLLNPFLEKLKEYYFESKQFYITRKQNYNTFITLIRQICRQNNINYTSNIKYNRSTYDMIYHIYF